MGSSFRMVNKYSFSINVSETCIKLNNAIILFSKEEHFETLTKTRKIIDAYISDKDIDAGYVSLSDMDKKILFVNFIVINDDGKVYREQI
jgi:gamma-glutamyl phosphate reductase